MTPVVIRRAARPPRVHVAQAPPIAEEVVVAKIGERWLGKARSMVLGEFVEARRR